MRKVVVGNKIRNYRKERRLTQQELADKVGVTWEMISRYERGESIPFFKLDKISEALNVKLAELLQEDDKASNHTTIPRITNTLQLSDKNLIEDFYDTPSWLLGEESLMAIDSAIVSNLPKGFGSKGVIFVSYKREPNKDDYVLIEGDGKALCEKYRSQKRYVGVIVGQEIKLL